MELNGRTERNICLFLDIDKKKGEKGMKIRQVKKVICALLKW